MAPLLYQLFRRELRFFHHCGGGVRTPVDGMVSQNYYRPHRSAVRWSDVIDLRYSTLHYYNSNSWRQAWQIYFTNWFIQMWSWLRTVRTSSLPRHEGEGESDNDHRCGALNPVTGQTVTKGDVRVKKWYRHNAPLFQGGYHHRNDWDSESTCHCDAHGPRPPLGHSVTPTRCVFSR